MAGILRHSSRVARNLAFLILRCIQQLWKFAYGPLRPIAFKAFRRLWIFLSPVLLPAIRAMRFLNFYIGPFIPIIFKILSVLKSFVERLLSLLTVDENKPKTKGLQRGLQNLGNTCYFNSVMQALCHTHKLEKQLRESPASGELTESFREFYIEMLCGKSESFSPDTLHLVFREKSSRFDNRMQHDSHECLRHFLDTIRNEERIQLKEKGMSSSNKKLTVVDEVFGGHLMTVYICVTCQNPYHVCEPCLDISLPICFERGTEDGEQALKKAMIDTRMTSTRKELETNEDKYSDDSERERTDNEDMWKREGDDSEHSENDEREDTEEDTEEDIEKEEEEEEEEEEEKEDVKKEEENTKARGNELEPTEKKIVKKIEAEEDEYEEKVNYDEDNGEQHERKQHKPDGEIETKTEEEKKKDDEKEQAKEEANGQEVDERTDLEKNEDNIKKEANNEEEDNEEKEEDEALGQQQYNILDKIQDAEEKQGGEDKYEKEKVEGDETDRRKEKDKDDERQKHGKPREVTAQNNSLLVINNKKEQRHSNELQVRPQKAFSSKLNRHKKMATNGPEVVANVKSQEKSCEDHRNKSPLKISENYESSKESDSYRKTVRLLMQPLSTYSNTRLNSSDKNSKSVEDCLMYFTRKEHIKDEYLCNDFCSKYMENGGTDVLLTSATKQTLIFNPPAVLTLHLKRFELKPGGSVKRTDTITYGEYLDIAPYCSSKCLRNDPRSRNIWYSLYGVVVHSGSLESGHYTAYVKAKQNKVQSNRFLQMNYFDPKLNREELIEMTMNTHKRSHHSALTDKVWYFANDSNIREVSLSEVLNQEAYLLFYERVP